MGQNTSMNGFRLQTGSWAFRLAALALIAVTMSVATGFLMVHWLIPAEGTAAPPAEPPVDQPILFRGWPKENPGAAGPRKPDVVLLLSGQEHGYLQPCGCSRPQLGGLARRYNLMQSLIKDRGWAVVAVDLGDIIDGPQHRGPQTLLKYKTSMDALRMMNYTAVAIGQSETEMPLFTTVGEYALNYDKPPVLAGNLMNKDVNFAGAVKAWATSGAVNGSATVGVTAIVGPGVAKQVPKQDPEVQFAPTRQVLALILQEMQKQNPELLVLLYHGDVESAKECAKQFPQFHVILCLTKESEPPANPDRVGNTLIVSVGHKGRYVGLVGAYRTGKPARPFELYYQLMTLSEDYETPKDQPDNPIMKLMEDYARQVDDGNYLAKYPQRKHPLQAVFPKAEYVGSDKCIKCHKEAAKVWKNTPHHHAYDTLAKATRPALRQHDGECIVCHTVGFGHETGFKDEKMPNGDRQITAHLKDVGCESCHGPGSIHVANTLRGAQKDQLMELMNPYRPKKDETPADTKRRLNLIDQSCQKCHDGDNDVHWDFEKKWPKVTHPETGGAPRSPNPFPIPDAKTKP